MKPDFLLVDPVLEYNETEAAGPDPVLERLIPEETEKQWENGAGIDRLIEKMAALAPEPCRGCPLRSKCAAEQLACEQFYQFVMDEERAWKYATPPTREPTRRIYEAVFDSDDIARFDLRPPKRGTRKDWLDAETVRQVRAAEGSDTAIARQVGIGRTTVHKIRTGTAYQHVV